MDTNNPLVKMMAEITALHEEKGKAYGGSWKRRGEIFSIIPNILRKTDRIENIVLNGADNPASLNESILDTFQDTFVYVTMYYTWLTSSGDEYYSDETARENMWRFLEAFCENRELVGSDDTIWEAASDVVKFANELADYIEGSFREGVQPDIDVRIGYTISMAYSCLGALQIMSAQ